MLVVLPQVQVSRQPRRNWRRLAPPLIGTGLNPVASPPLDPSDGDIVASVVGTAVVGESPEVSIVVDGVGAVAASASAVVTEPCTLVAVGEAVAAGLGWVL